MDAGPHVKALCHARGRRARARRARGHTDGAAHADGPARARPGARSVSARIAASAPGKLMISGEYAVLEGAVAVVASVARAYAAECAARCRPPRRALRRFARADRRFTAKATVAPRSSASSKAGRGGFGAVQASWPSTPASCVSPGESSASARLRPPRPPPSARVLAQRTVRTCATPRSSGGCSSSPCAVTRRSRPRAAAPTWPRPRSAASCAFGSTRARWPRPSA